MKLELIPLQRDSVRHVKPTLMALFGGAGFLLLVCCLNVSSLFITRASERRKEIALRSALGATRGRILRHMLLESLVLCTAAGAAGLGLGWAGVHGLSVIRPVELARMDVELSWQALGFAAAVSLAAATFFGLAPGLGAVRSDLVSGLGRGGRGSPAQDRRGVRALLIVTEVAIGFVLVIGAGLMIRTLRSIEEVRPGFESRHLLTFEIDLSRSASPKAAIEFVERYEARLAALPGVDSVGAVSHLPLDDYPNWYGPYRAEGQAAKDSRSQTADHRAVTPGYLRALGTRLLEGRFFDGRDLASGHQTAIVDEMLARSAWPGRSAVGKRIEVEHFTAEGIRPVWSEVVGVVEHVRNHSLAKKLRGEVYLPFTQSPREHLSFVVRTHLDPLAVADEIQRESHRLDKDLALAKVRPMQSYVERATAPVSFIAVLGGIFALLALLLAAIGIFGLSNYSVSRRRKEIGIRLAVGATSTDVLRLVLGEGLGLTALGMIFGGVGAIIVSRSLRGLIYGVPTLDPLTYSVALAVIPAAALIGCLWPATRATAVNPVDVLRAE